MLDLEGLGLQVRSLEWGMLFSAVLISWICLQTFGVAMLYYGIWRARRLGEDTEYLLTDSRLLIRRGPVELSIDRAHIVEVAEQRAPRGLVHLYIVLDGPGAHALAVSGAMGPITPARDAVPPVLFDVRKTSGAAEALLARSKT